MHRDVAFVSLTPIGFMAIRWMERLDGATRWNAPASWELAFAPTRDSFSEESRRDGSDNAIEVKRTSNAMHVEREKESEREGGRGTETGRTAKHGRKKKRRNGQVEEAERESERGEGFITKDLLLLPGGGEALERATALHTWGAFIRCADLYVPRIHGHVHVTWMAAFANSTCRVS